MLKKTFFLRLVLFFKVSIKSHFGVLYKQFHCKEANFSVSKLKRWVEDERTLSR